MPKKDKSSGDHVISESGNWNVAAQFSKSKIMDPLDRCDIYENLARYGYYRQPNSIEDISYVEAWTE